MSQTGGEYTIPKDANPIHLVDETHFMGTNQNSSEVKWPGKPNSNINTERFNEAFMGVLAKSEVLTKNRLNKSNGQD